MNACRRRLLAAAVLPALAGAGCVNRDPAIGLVLIYQATGPTEIQALWLDSTLKLGTRGSVMHIDADSPAHEAWTNSGSASPAPSEIRASWRYEAIEPGDDTAPHGRPEGRARWREAQASVALRGRIAPDALALLHSDPKRHRLELVLIFDRDRLDVRWQVQRWR